MSNSLQGDCRKQDAVGGGSRKNVKCRIPQRLTQNLTLVGNEKSKAASELVENSQQKMMRSGGTSPSVRCPLSRNIISRLQRTESGKNTALPPRPRSASSRKDEAPSPPRQPSSLPRTSRPIDRRNPPINVPKPNMRNRVTAPLSPKKIETPMGVAKQSRPIITIPTNQYCTHGARRGFQRGDVDELPDQETITRCEDLEIHRQLSGITEIVQELKNGGPIKLSKDKVQHLKDSWENNIQMFERMKCDLSERQKTLLELYATMKNVHQIMANKGQKIEMPSAAEVKFMNMSHINQDSIVQLAVGENKTPSTTTNKQGTSTPSGTMSPIGNNQAIDVNRLYNLPQKLIATCEQTIHKRREIIDWFESLKNEGKGIRMGKLNKKIDEFNAENEILECLLEKEKKEVLQELSAIVDYFRSTVDDTIKLQLHSEELTYEIINLNAKNSELKHQIYNSEHLKSSNLRHTIEEMEKELKEERCKKALVRDRLSRTEGQVKMGAEALKQANIQIQNQQIAIQQLQDQNNTLQLDFEKEINKLSESIKENTAHLEEIAEAREKLQSEKDNLEKRLSELSDNYNDSLQALKEELNLNIMKVTETEHKFEEEKGERIKLEVKMERLCGQLFSAELRYKELLTQLEEKDEQLNKMVARQIELDSVKQELNNARKGIDEYRNKLERHADKLQSIEMEYQQVLDTQANLRRELALKDDQLKEKENKMELLSQQLQESESKMVSYEEQLMDLKNHLADLQQEFGEFQTIPELHDMVNKQRQKVLEVTRENGDLVEALNRKELELEQHVDQLNELEQHIEQKDEVIKMLTEKEEEQATIIKALRNNIEMRAMADNEMSQKLMEKESILDNYSAEIETKNQKIAQLEMLILTLEEQLRKVNLVRTRELDKNKILEKTIADYEAYQMKSKLNAETPTENLDNLIKSLEDELCSPFHTHISMMEPKYKKKVEDAKHHYKTDKTELHEGYPMRHEKPPTKIEMANFVKKTYISTNEEQEKGDNLDRKRAITNMNTQRVQRVPAIETENWMSREADVKFNSYPPPPVTNESGFRLIPPRPPMRNLPYIPPANYFREDKKSKMLKLAGHRM